MKQFYLTLALFFIGYLSYSQAINEWRGVGRTGFYDETGLLKAWPEKGPNLLWFTDSLPDGYSSVSIANNTIYLTGIVDTMDIVIALDMEGKELWRTSYGRCWDASFQNSRATPTVEKSSVYVSSGKGDLACVDANKGNLIWSVNASEIYGGTFGKWGLAESILVDGEKVFFTPGGSQTTMIALHKKSGKLIWKSESLGDGPSYASPLLVKNQGKKIIVNIVERNIFGINPENGKILWKFDYTKYKTGRNNYTNTPLYHNNELFITSGYNHSSVKLKLTDDLTSVSLAWVDTVLDTHHGGVVRVGEYIYGSNWIHNRKGNWVCLDWKTGKAKYEKEWKNKGAIIAADGMLYCFEEKTGYLALVKADPKEFKVISSFKVPKGKGPYWAHPVIKDGILYIRHGKAVMAYDIKAR